MKSNKAGYVFLYVFAFMLLSSCAREANQTDTKSKFVVLAEITAGDSAFIPIGKSRVTRSGAAISFDKFTTASVSITDENNLITSLRYNDAPEFLQNPTAIYHSGHVFSHSKTYVLKASHPLLGSIMATTHIPTPVLISTVTTSDKELQGRKVMEFDFTIQDQVAEDNYYVFEAVKQLVQLKRSFVWQGVSYNYDTAGGKKLYDSLTNQHVILLIKDTIPTHRFLRLNVYTFDKKTDNTLIANLDSPFHRIFITDSVFNGKAYHSFFAVAKDHFEATDPGQAGRVLIKIKSVTKDLYNYLLEYEKYRSAFGTIPTQQLSSPTGNIENGLGVFGGVSKKEWVYYYDSLK